MVFFSVVVLPSSVWEADTRKVVVVFCFVGLFCFSRGGEVGVFCQGGKKAKHSSRGLRNFLL